MKRFISIIILSSFLFSAIEFKEFSKFSQLIEHFKEHRILNSEVTFSQFIFMHYGLTDDHDGDEEKDAKLPFKNHQDCFLSHAQLAIHQTPVITIKSTEENIKKYFFYPQVEIPQGSLTSIWQPPKNYFFS